MIDEPNSAYTRSLLYSNAYIYDEQVVEMM